MHSHLNIPEGAKPASGVLPLFDQGKTVLLGKEFRSKMNTSFWNGMGGKVEEGETFAEAALRETLEETAYTLKITLEQVLESERKGHFVDFHNPKSNFYFRMYVVIITSEKIDPKVFLENSIGKDKVEMVEWRYFNTSDLMSSMGGSLPDTEFKIYPTMMTRLAMLREKEFVKELL